MHILIIEDEFNLADAIGSMLESENYNVTILTDGRVGYENALTGIYDLIILDVMLPNKNGFEILKDLREEHIESKIIMLTAKSTIEDKMAGFNKGADDYLTKPFYMDELLARVNLQLRKNYGNQNILSFGDLELDIKNMSLKNSNNNLTVDIIGKEFDLLEILLRNTKQIIEKELLFAKIWGYDSDSEINTLEAYISFLRKKLKLIKSTVQIKVVRNIGYKLEVGNEKTRD